MTSLGRTSDHCIMAEEQLRKIIDQTSAHHRAGIESGAWWHSIRLPDGTITRGVHSIDELEENYRYFALPDDLTGKRVLDMGCWDGFYSFEVERHGAQVVAADCWQPPNFHEAQLALDSSVEFREMSVYELGGTDLGTFDIVFFLGVLYHLHHPLLALQKVCEVTREVAIIETHVIDNTFLSSNPVMEFYEFDELGGQYDNWWGPNSDCLIRMLRTAGFARTEILRKQPTRIVLKAHRKWEMLELRGYPTMSIADVTNAKTFDHHLPRRGRSGLLAIWLDGLPDDAARDTVQVEVGGFGVNPYFVGRSPDPPGKNRAQINVVVPPGLGAGPASVKVIFKDQFSDEMMINLSESGEW
jgi:tRNA (mo5U34)-methyltransferase